MTARKQTKAQKLTRKEWEEARILKTFDAATFEIRRAEDIAPAFEALKDRADALYVVGDALVITHRVRINTLALIARLPTIYVVREYVEAGGLMSYGPNFPKQRTSFVFRQLPSSIA